jgi:hypothetical protein
MEAATSESPFERISLLLDAAALLAPGGTLVFSYLYCFADDPSLLHETLEPAAIYQCLIRHGFRAWDQDPNGTERVAIYHDPDTLFVAHRAVLDCRTEHMRLVRVLGAVREVSGRGRLTMKHQWAKDAQTAKLLVRGAARRLLVRR